MTVTAYRLSLRQYRSRAFAGDGARRAGGRWNPRGFPAVYCSSALSLAALEFLAHLGSPQDAPELVYFAVEFSEHHVATAELPRNWRRLKLIQTRALGRKWLESGSSPVLRVPSFIVPSEYNYVLNPLHPGFGKLQISRPKSFNLDPRLYQAR